MSEDLRQRRVLTEGQLGPHGMSCMTCQKPLEAGDIYAEVFEGITENPTELTGTPETHIPIVVIVCDACGSLPDIHERIAAIP